MGKFTAQNGGGGIKSSIQTELNLPRLLAVAAGGRRELENHLQNVYPLLFKAIRKQVHVRSGNGWRGRKRKRKKKKSLWEMLSEKHKFELIVIMWGSGYEFLTLFCWQHFQLLKSIVFVSLQADWATALILWCLNMEVSAAIRRRAEDFPIGAPSTSSVSLDTTSAATFAPPGVATGSGCLRYRPASRSEVRW